MTTTAKANTPQMMDGMPVRSLATRRTVWARRDVGAYSLMKIAERMPAGADTARPMPTMARVPRMALPKPPPVIPAAGGNSVKIPAPSKGRPCFKRRKIIEIKGTIVRSESVMQTPLRMRFVKERATVFEFTERSPSKKSKEWEAMGSIWFNEYLRFAFGCSAARPRRAGLQQE